MTVRQPPDPAASPATGWRTALRIGLIVVPLGIAGNLIFTLVATDREILRALADFPRGYLLLAVALALVPWATNTVRLWIWTDFLGYRISFRQCFVVVLGTNLGSGVSPTAVGGAAFKWGMLIQRGVSPGASASLTTLATVEDFLFFLVALPLAAVISGAWRMPLLREMLAPVTGNLPLVAAVVVVLGLLGWLTVWLLRGRSRARAAAGREGALHRLRRSVRGAWWDAVDVYQGVIRHGKRRFALSMVFVTIQWCSRYMIIAALVAFLGGPVQVFLFFFLQWIVFTIMTFVPTPGATGGAEAAFLLVFGPLLPDRIIGVATAGWRFLTYYLQLSLGAVIFALIHLRSRQTAESH